MKLHLDEWQEKAIKTQGNLLLCTGRQIGKTTIMAIKAAIRMTERTTKIVVASLTQDQAQLIIAMTFDYLERNHKTSIARGKHKPTQNKIHLKNGSSMIARPVGTTGNAIRGFTGDVLIVDEGSRILPKIWTAAKPTLLSTGGEIWMCSTPNGKRTKKGKLNYFYECSLNKNNRYTVIIMDSETAINNREISETWTKEKKEKAIQFLADEKKDMTHLQYAQEYLAQFVDEIRQLFPNELIDKICILKRREEEPRPKEYTDFTLGVDVGRYGEGESTFEILDGTHKEAIIQVENITTKKTALTLTSDKIIMLDNQYDFGRRCIGIDSTGAGAGVFDDLWKHSREMQNKIVGLENARRVIEKSLDSEDKLGRLMKEHLYNALIIAMERGEILLLDDDEIKESLRSIQVDYNESGKICIYGYYSHIAEGIVRALWCVKNKGLNIYIY